MSAAAKAVFEADSSKLDSALLRIQKSMLKLQQVTVGAHVAFEALKVAGEFIAKQFEHLKESFALGKELNELSARTGVAVSDLVELSEEFKNAGKSAEEIGPAFNKMQKNIGTGAAAETIAHMGVNLQSLKAMTPNEQFHTLGKAIAAMQSPMDRVQASMAIFGKAGAELLPLFAEKGFGEMTKEMSNKAAILQRDAGVFADITNSLRIVGNKVNGFWLGIADKVGPILKPLLDGLKGLDFTRVGQQLGDVLATFIQSLADGSIVRILGDALALGGAMGINTLIAGLAELGDFLLDCLVGAFTDSEADAMSGMDDVATYSGGVISNALGTAWGKFERFVNSSLGGLGPLVGEELFQAGEVLVEACAVITKADFWKGVGNSLLAAAMSFNALMLDGISAVLDSLSNIPKIGGAFAAKASSLRGSAQGAREGAAEKNKDSDTAYGHALDPLLKKMQDAMTAIIAKQPKGWESWSGIDTKPLADALAKSIAKERDVTKRVSEKSLADSPTAQVNAIGDSVLGAQDKVSHLQRIGGGGIGGGVNPMHEAQKRTNSLLSEVRGFVKDIRDKRPESKPEGIHFT